MNKGISIDEKLKYEKLKGLWSSSERPYLKWGARICGKQTGNSNKLSCWLYPVVISSGKKKKITNSIYLEIYVPITVISEVTGDTVKYYDNLKMSYLYPDSLTFIFVMLLLYISLQLFIFNSLCL